MTTISIHSPTPGGSLAGSSTGNYLTVIAASANNGSRGNGGLNSFTAVDSITLLPSGCDEDVIINSSRGSSRRSRSSAVALALAASKIRYRVWLLISANIDSRFSIRSHGSFRLSSLMKRMRQVVVVVVAVTNGIIIYGDLHPIPEEV